MVGLLLGPPSLNLSMGTSSKQQGMCIREVSPIPIIARSKPHAHGVSETCLELGREDFMRVVRVFYKASDRPARKSHARIPTPLVGSGVFSFLFFFGGGGLKK